MNGFKRIITLSILLLSLFYSNDAFAYIQNQNSEISYNNSENNMTIHPLYCDPSIITCWGEYEKIYFDAPWRANPDRQVEVYAIINKIYDIKRAVVYDDINENIVAEKVFDTILSLNESQLPYVINFSIDPSGLSRINNNIRLKMVLTIRPYELIDIPLTEGPLNITLSTEPLPIIKNWYYGDTHYHSSYTFNEVELGGPLPATIRAMDAIGLDWVTVTDHSFTLKTDEKWNAFKEECNNYPNCLIGEEISCDNDGPLDYNHYLGYNITRRIYSGEYLDNGTSPLQCSDVVNHVNAQGGFGYVAHPFYREGYYQDGFGLAYRNTWQNYSLPFTGMEIWNIEERTAELEQGLIKWRELLLNGRKVLIEAGSDAHGDFNSALGKVRTVCFANSFTKDNIFTALKNGNCMMTDGPIVVFTANKHIIGESFNVSEGDTIALNISWNSTNEFGNLTEIILIRGEINGNETNETILWPNNLSGNFVRTSAPNNTYYRIEAKSTDSEGKIRRAYTNPIWVYAVPKPEISKILMDEAELALVSAFENKYDYSLKDLYFDSEPTINCDANGLRENLNLNSSWQIVKCEKMILDNKRLMWAGINNTETNEKKIMLQIGGILQFTKATYNEFRHAWINPKIGTWVFGVTGNYINYNWIANKNGVEVFEIDELHNSNQVNEVGRGSGDFGTYLIHGFGKYEGNTTTYYTYWFRTPATPHSIRDVYLKFDNKTAYPITNGYIMNTKGIFQKKAFDYGASSFGFGADGAFYYGYNTGWEIVSGSGFDQINRTIFPVSQTESIVSCHTNIDCNDGDLLTKDICINAGTIESKCENTPQEPEEIKKPFTEMDADEVSKAIYFRNKYRRTLGELYFDGWKNTTCNNDGILDTLKLDRNWSILQCKKFLINNTLAMFAALNKSTTGEKYAAYQLGNVLIDENATYSYITETYQYPKLVDKLTYYLDRWAGIKNGTERFEIDYFRTKSCSISSCTDVNYYGTYIIHGFYIDRNKNTSLLYSFSKSINGAIFGVLFDNYREFGIENETQNSGIYETRTFDYRALRGWAFGTFGFNYTLNNKSLFFPYRANELVVGLESPAHLSVRDTEGRTTGYSNGTYMKEIPGSEILDKVHEKYSLPANENYLLFIYGYEEGNYSLKITRASGENASLIYFRNISATNETRDMFELNGTDSIGVKTNDSEKNIFASLENIYESPENVNFTVAWNKSAAVRVSNWSALNESTEIIETINYPPEIISAYPENNSALAQGQTIPISINASDANNDTLSYSISFDGTEISRAKEINYTLNEAGVHAINFSTSDGLNSVSKEMLISVIAPPKIKLTSPENKTYNTSTVFLNALFEEPVHTAWLSLDGSSGQNYTGNVSYLALNLSGLSDGLHNVSVYANNSIGIENVSSAFFSVNAGSAPPSNCGKGNNKGKKEKKDKDKDKKDKENHKYEKCEKDKEDTENKYKED